MAQDLPVSTDDGVHQGFDSRCARWLSEMSEGNEQALNALYDATLGRVYAVAKSIVGESSNAEDVVTDVYWQAWTTAGKYEPARGRPITWLLTICRSRAIDEYRRLSATRRGIEAATAEQLPLVDEPDDLLQVAEKGHIVHGLLEEMEPAQRQLVALAFFRDLSHQQISDCTGLPLGTVKSNLRRALQKLRQALAEHGAQLQP